VWALLRWARSGWRLLPDAPRPPGSKRTLLGTIQSVIVDYVFLGRWLALHAAAMLGAALLLAGFLFSVV